MAATEPGVLPVAIEDGAIGDTIGDVNGVISPVAALVNIGVVNRINKEVPNTIGSNHFPSSSSFSGVPTLQVSRVFEFNSRQLK